MNAISQHTPGPWAVGLEVDRHPYSEHRGFRIRAEMGVVAEIFPKPHLVIVSFANAQLIAAAPALLEALVAVKQRLFDLMEYETDQLPEECEELLKARAAIAKATGASA